MGKLTSYDLCGEDPTPIACDEVEGLKTLVMMLGDNPIIIQIGAGVGISTLSMLEERPDALIYSVDQLPCETEFENIRKAELDETRVIRLLGKSHEVGANWNIVADMVFIDGDHREEWVRKDIETWVKWVKPDGGIVAFHDYIPEPIPPWIKGSVVYAVDDLMRGCKEIMFINRLKAFVLEKNTNEHI